MFINDFVLNQREHDNMIFCVVAFDISYSMGNLEMLNLKDTFDPNFHYSLFWGDCKHPSVKTTVVYI